MFCLISLALWVISKRAICCATLINLFINAFTFIFFICNVYKTEFWCYKSKIRVWIKRWFWSFIFFIYQNIINMGFIIIALNKIWNEGCNSCACLALTVSTSLGFLKIDVLVFNLRDEHIFSNFEHSEWCHFIILIYRFNQSWKVFQFIDVRLHVLWVRVDQLLQLIFSFVDLIEDLILVSWLKFIG